MDECRWNRYITSDGFNETPLVSLHRRVNVSGASAKGPPTHAVKQLLNVLLETSDLLLNAHLIPDVV